MPLVTRWTGRETRALREALRMTTAELGMRLGVSDRIVARWESRGETANIRPVNQASLDTLLSTSDDEAHGRFAGLLADDEEVPPRRLVEAAVNLVLTGDYVKHHQDGRWMTGVPEGVYLSGADSHPAWLDEFWIDVHPVTNADYARFVTSAAYDPPAHWEGGRVDPRFFQHPVVEVSHVDASAYA
ncbi:MAG: SUMF1/EgtB/PvdO family nonheme iron enzyme, partial [Phycicoccus sp.]